MTNKELFVEYLKLNNMVPPDFDQGDLPDWDMFNMDAMQPWDMYNMGAMQPWDYYGAMTPYSEDISQRMWNRPGWRRRPGPSGPWRGPRYNAPFAPLFWWWLLF